MTKKTSDLLWVNCRGTPHAFSLSDRGRLVARHCDMAAEADFVTLGGKPGGCRLLLDLLRMYGGRTFKNMDGVRRLCCDVTAALNSLPLFRLPIPDSLAAASARTDRRVAAASLQVPKSPGDRHGVLVRMVSRMTAAIRDAVGERASALFARFTMQKRPVYFAHYGIVHVMPRWWRRVRNCLGVVFADHVVLDALWQVSPSGRPALSFVGVPLPHPEYRQVPELAAFVVAPSRSLREGITSEVIGWRSSAWYRSLREPCSYGLTKITIGDYYNAIDAGA